MGTLNTLMGLMYGASVSTGAMFAATFIEPGKLHPKLRRALPLCAVCPAAQWYRIEDDQRTPRLEAFCTAFRGVMYDHRRRAVTACDGRTDTIEGGTKARPGPA